MRGIDKISHDIEERDRHGKDSEFHRKTDFNGAINWKLEEIRGILSVPAHEAKHREAELREAVGAGRDQCLPAQEESGAFRMKFKTLVGRSFGYFPDGRDFHETEMRRHAEEVFIKFRDFQPWRASPVWDPLCNKC